MDNKKMAIEFLRNSFLSYLFLLAVIGTMMLLLGGEEARWREAVQVMTTIMGLLLLLAPVILFSKPRDPQKEFMERMRKRVDRT